MLLLLLYRRIHLFKFSFTWCNIAILQQIVWVFWNTVLCNMLIFMLHVLWAWIIKWKLYNDAEQLQSNEIRKHIIKELQKIYTAKAKLEILQEDVETRNANAPTAEANYLKSLFVRKHILIAKSLDVISDIEAILRQKYNNILALK